MNRRTLDLILGQYEQRPPILPYNVEVERRAGLEFGWELNRLQGAEMDDVDTRLADLYATGRVTRPEYVELVRQLALAEQREKVGA